MELQDCQGKINKQVDSQSNHHLVLASANLPEKSGKGSRQTAIPVRLQAGQLLLRGFHLVVVKELCTEVALHDCHQPTRAPVMLNQTVPELWQASVKVKVLTRPLGADYLCRISNEQNFQFLQ